MFFELVSDSLAWVRDGAEVLDWVLSLWPPRGRGTLSVERQTYIENVDDPGWACRRESRFRRVDEISAACQYCAATVLQEYTMQYN